MHCGLELISNPIRLTPGGMTVMNRWILLIVIALLLAPGVPALAAGTVDEAEMLNRVDFQVRAEREVANDLMQATLVAEYENKDPGRLAAELNRTMAWALEQARSDDAVRARSGNYRTMPVYPPNQRQISHWRGHQELILESMEPDRLNALIGRLQERLQVRGMHFTVSREQRDELAASLTTEALARFRERAGEIAGSLGAVGYDIVRVGIIESGDEPPARIMRMASFAEDTAVASEPGTSRLAVMVSAVIRLRF